MIPKKIKGTGFFTPMDIVPDESNYGYDMREFKRHCLMMLEEHYGERCETKDTDDFPEMLEPPYANNDKDWGRCPVCLVYEKFDAFWETFYYDDDDLEVS